MWKWKESPQLSRDCLLSSHSLAVTEFISISAENYSSAVVRSEASGIVTSTCNSWGSRGGEQAVFWNVKGMQPSCKVIDVSEKPAVPTFMAEFSHQSTQRYIPSTIVSYGSINTYHYIVSQIPEVWSIQPRLKYCGYKRIHNCAC